MRTRYEPVPPRKPQSDPPAKVPYAGDFEGMPDVDYSPRDDGVADPGEVVWAWVPYEENHKRGKDRPVLVIGRHVTDSGVTLLALPLTSMDHDVDKGQEEESGRYWVEIGSGGWDRYGRVSEVRVNRILQLDPTAVRREGDQIDRETFDRVVTEVRRHAR